MGTFGYVPTIMLISRPQKRAAGGGKIIEVAKDEERQRSLYFISERCVGCGTCENVCPKGAITVYRDGRKFDISLNGCILCGICSDLCQFGALRFYTDGKEGSFIIETLKDEFGYKKIVVSGNCILCALCEEVCPRNAMSVRRSVDLKKLRRGTVEIGDGCINCRLCVENCPTKAVRIYHGKPVIDESKCIYCEICARICPMNVIDVRCDSCRIIGEASNAVSGEVLVDERSCSACGMCSEVCPVDAIKVFKMLIGDQKWYAEKCYVDCTVCRDVCPNNAISYEYSDGKLVVFSDRCNYCGACERFCPGNAIEITRQLALPVDIGVTIDGTRKARRKVIKVDKDCIGCGVCVAICPLSKDGKTIEVIDGSAASTESSDCTACGLCVASCPIEGIEVREVVE